MADKYKFLFSLLPHFFILFFNKRFPQHFKSFFWGSFYHSYKLHDTINTCSRFNSNTFYPKQIALEFITIPRKLFLPSVTEAASSSNTKIII